MTAQLQALENRLLIAEEMIRQLGGQVEALGDTVAAERAPDLNGALHRRRRVYLRTADGGLETWGPFQAAAGQWVVVDVRRRR